MEGVIRILLVDDHPVVLSGLQAALDAQPDLRVTATAGSVGAARSALARGGIDVAIVDLRLPDGSGLDLIESSGGGEAPPPIIYLTTFDAPHYAQVAADRGASGFILKTAPIEAIVDSVRRAATGQLSFTREQLRPSARAAWQPLTARERAIVVGVVRGRSNDEIAGELGISPRTVEWYLARLFDRFDVASRTELATRAEREGWLDLPVKQPRSR